MQHYQKIACVATMFCLLCCLISFFSPRSAQSDQNLAVNVESVSPPIDKLIEQLRSKDPNERILSAQQLCLRGKDAEVAFPELIELLADDTQVQLDGSTLGFRYHMRRLFIRMGPMMTDSLMKALSHKSRLVRMGAAEALGGLRAERAVDALIERLGEADREVTLQVTAALVNIGESSIDPLLKTLAGNNTSARQCAVGALGSIRHERVVQPVAKLLFDPDPKMREWAVYSLHRLAFNHPLGTIWPPAVDPNDEKAVKAREKNDAALRKIVCRELNLALESDSTAARLAAAQCCRLVSSLDNRDALAKCMSAKNVALRTEAVQAIMGIDDPSVLKLLLQALGDSIDDVRAAAANGLRYRSGSFSSGEELIEPFMKALQDSDHRVRQNAVEALAALQSPQKRKAVPEVIKLLNDPDAEVVNAAIRSLTALNDKQAVEPIHALLNKPLFHTPAAVALASFHDPRCVEPLRTFLTSKDTNVIRALGRIKDRESVYPLIMLLEDPQESVRHAAADALGEMGDIRAIEPLGEAMQNDKRIFYSAGQALSRIKHPYSVWLLINAARSEDENYYFHRFGRIRDLGIAEDVGRSSFTWPLCSMGAVAVEPLANALTDSSNHVRSLAAWVLHQLITRKDVDHEDLAPAIEPLITALSDPSDVVRYHAALALGALNNAQAVNTLVDAIAASDHTVYQYRSAVHYLSTIGDPNCVEPLINLLESDKPAVRENAADVLGSLRDQRAVLPLLALLKDSQETVRATAACALGNLKATAAIDALQELLTDKEPKVRIAATYALSCIGKLHQCDLLVKLAEDDQDFQVQVVAAIGLLRLKDPRGLQFISAHLRDKDEKRRLEAVERLCWSSLKDKELVTLLIETLNDSSVDIRHRSADALSGIESQAATNALLAKVTDRQILYSVLAALAKTKDDPAFEVLVQHLDDSEAEIRRWAAYQISASNRQSGVQPLLRHADDPSPQVRIAVIDALANLHAIEARAAIKQALDDVNPDVRSHAARVLRKLGG